MTPPPEPARPLRAVPKTDRPQPLRVFCGHCGRSPAEPSSTELVTSRVCPKCGMGLLLQAAAEVAPAPKDPFIVVDSSLTVCAVSRQAEDLLGVPETEAVNRHIAEFLAAGDAEAPDGDNLAATISWAARGDAPLKNMVVRPTNTFGVRYWARVGSCGPPTAALLVLADAR